jgi:hypothetical protein
MRPYLFVFGFGLPAFSSFEAAAAFCVARFVALLCLPGSGLQLPFVPGFLPSAGSKPGQHGLPFCDLEAFLPAVFVADVLVCLFALVFLVVIAFRMSRLRRTGACRRPRRFHAITISPGGFPGIGHMHKPGR